VEATDSSAPRGAALLVALILAGLGLLAATRPLWSPTPPDRRATENAVSMIAVSDPLLVGHALDINAATASELDLLPGIGKALSARIVEEREANGPYRDAADLADRVVGVGDDLARDLAPHIRFGP
jgi:competence protein ComEA